MEPEETDITKAYDYEKLEPYYLPENLEPPSDSDEESPANDSCRSFPLFRQKMTNVTDDGKVMKMVCFLSKRDHNV